MNKIECPCCKAVCYYNNETAERKKQFKIVHKPHLENGKKFKIYPSDLLQIATNMTIKNEDGENYGQSE